MHIITLHPLWSQNCKPGYLNKRHGTVKYNVLIFLFTISSEMGVWACSLCHEESSGKKVRNLLLRIQQEMEELLNSPASSVQVGTLLLRIQQEMEELLNSPAFSVQVVCRSCYFLL